MNIINCFCDKNVDLKLFKKRLTQIKVIKMRFMLVSIFNSKNKIKFLKKNDIFGYLGENVLYQPLKLPNNPKLIKIHNNVRIAADVIFYEHDVINEMFSRTDNKSYFGHLSCIEIFDNVFVGGHSIIIGNVKIGPNAIIGAGSVVTKDVPEGSIVAGNPAIVVGKFDDLYKKRQKEVISDKDKNKKLLDQYNDLWKSFYNR